MKFSSKKNISRKKSKPIPVTLANVRKVMKIQAFHTEGLSWLWDTVASHCVINQHYVKKFREEFRHNEIIYETGDGDYKTKYDTNIYFTLPKFSGNKLLTIDFISIY